MMKGQKGITLVALVITIIIMLILAGVTISVVVNGGLFQQAGDAATETNKASLNEAIQIAAGEAYGAFYGGSTNTQQGIIDLLVSNIEADSANKVEDETTTGFKVTRAGFETTVTVSVNTGENSLTITNTEIQPTA